MPLETTEVRFKGKDTYLPSVRIGCCTVIETGKVLKVAQLFDEELVLRSSLPEPAAFLPKLAASPLQPDIFVYSQRPPDNTPHHPYPMEWDNWAVAATGSFQTWWEALPQESRKNARFAEKKGVTVRCVPFDDALIHGIKRIYDETPIRQGRPFWHYGKSFEAVKKENGTYLERSLFIGAFLQEQLIGFIKIIQVDEIATLIQILAMAKHRDKKPMNALLKHTMEVCEQRGFSSLIYGNYTYGTNNDSSLTEFKRRNGFTETRFPRYFIPLTFKGRLAIKTGLHRGWRNLIPLPVARSSSGPGPGFFAHAPANEGPRGKPRGICQNQSQLPMPSIHSLICRSCSQAIQSMVRQRASRIACKQAPTFQPSRSELRGIGPTENEPFLDFLPNRQILWKSASPHGIGKTLATRA